MIVVPVFTHSSLGPTRVALAGGVGGIPHDSVLVCEEVTTLDHDLLENGPLGPRVPEELLSRVVRSGRRALGEIVLEP